MRKSVDQERLEFLSECLAGYRKLRAEATEKLENLRRSPPFRDEISRRLRRLEQENVLQLIYLANLGILSLDALVAMSTEGRVVDGRAARKS